MSRTRSHRPLRAAVAQENLPHLIRHHRTCREYDPDDATFLNTSAWARTQYAKAVNDGTAQSRDCDVHVANGRCMIWLDNWRALYEVAGGGGPSRIKTPSGNRARVRDELIDAVKDYNTNGDTDADIATRPDWLWY